MTRFISARGVVFAVSGLTPKLRPPIAEGLLIGAGEGPATRWFSWCMARMLASVEYKASSAATLWA